MNPFIVDGGHPEYVDIVKEAKEFLQLSDPTARLIENTGPGAVSELRGIREIADSTVAITDNDLIRAKALVPMVAHNEKLVERAFVTVIDSSVVKQSRP